MKKNEHWVNKCMDIRIESGSPVGKPIQTWLENVEADMAELEIDREDIHYRKKWRHYVMKRSSAISENGL